MKAVLHAPDNGNSVKEAGQSTAPKGDGSNLWAQLRRLKAEIGQIELVLTALKRDVARIDRKQYREAKDEPPSIPLPENERYPAGLFQ